ncbi:MAG: SPASM domain-containing protein [Candidatus Aminicenantes bacterium]|nr:SPASM domain-containing protein [Candidatus Aminicenantes bacterium]
MGEGGRNREEPAPRPAAAGADHPTPRRFLRAGGGRIVLPADLVKKLGTSLGARLEVRERDGRLEIRPNIHSLSRLYVEPTSRCNLACRTCIRNTWREPLGDMPWPLFQRLTAQLADLPHLESVMFAGFGEPTAHPDILRMIRAVKSRGLRAEITTNGTLLDGPMIDGLRRAGLDMLWASFDSAGEAGFEDIRRGAKFGPVVAALQALQAGNIKSEHPIKVGLSFVVMRRNVADLEALDELARRVGADRVLVSNILPYSAEMEKEMLCALTLTTESFAAAAAKTEVRLPRLDITPATRETILRLLRGYENLNLMGNPIFAETNYCRFVEDRTSFIRWDGAVAPCMGLLHGYKTFLYGYERNVKPHGFGNIDRNTLSSVWRSSSYQSFRERVREFDFAPCHICGGCNMLENNEEDCLGNVFPTCGGCLWAQGIIQCP